MLYIVPLSVPPLTCSPAGAAFRGSPLEATKEQCHHGNAIWTLPLFSVLLPRRQQWRYCAWSYLPCLSLFLCSRTHLHLGSCLYSQEIKNYKLMERLNCFLGRTADWWKSWTAFWVSLKSFAVIISAIILECLGTSQYHHALRRHQISNIWRVTAAGGFREA